MSVVHFLVISGSLLIALRCRCTLHVVGRVKNSDFDCYRMMRRIPKEKVGKGKRSPVQLVYLALPLCKLVESCTAKSTGKEVGEPLWGLNCRLMKGKVWDSPQSRRGVLRSCFLLGRVEAAWCVLGENAAWILEGKQPRAGEEDGVGLRGTRAPLVRLATLKAGCTRTVALSVASVDKETKINL